MRLISATLMVAALATGAWAQSSASGTASKGIVVNKIDGAGLKSVIAPKGRPMLVNFWATFCDPCRDEFPDLVKIAADYSGKIDVVTVSLDDPSEIATTVPEFLASMKADMPAFLLNTADETSVIDSISKDWGGGLPFTAVFDEKGKLQYQKLGKFRVEVLRQAIDRLLAEVTQNR